jgi:hypothetical protein
MNIKEFKDERLAYAKNFKFQSTQIEKIFTMITTDDNKQNITPQSKRSSIEILRSVMITKRMYSLNRVQSLSKKRYIYRSSTLTYLHNLISFKKSSRKIIIIQV